MLTALCYSLITMYVSENDFSHFVLFFSVQQFNRLIYTVYIDVV